MNNNIVIENDLDLSPKKNWEQHVWSWSAIIYTAAEGIYWGLQTFFKDTASTRHVAYYIVQWLLNVQVTTLLCFILYHFNFKKLWYNILINLIAFLAYYFLWIVLKYYLYDDGPVWLTGITHNNYPIEAIIYDSWFDIGNYVLTLATFYALKFYVDYKKAAQQRIQLAMINKDMQLNLLKQQLNPHFYFNTLNNLYGLARRSSARLLPALQQLQNIMEYVLTECNYNKVSLQKEIDFLKSYIALERLRYEEDTEIDLKINGDANGYTILPLLLIQFVENAFKHGMKEKSEENWMQVNINTSNETLFFSVNNSYRGGTFTEGVGLSSVKHRLSLQYDGKHSMQIQNTDHKFSVLLQINLS